MNILLLTEKDQTADGSYLVKGKDFKHLKNVLKVKVGGTVFTGLVNGMMGYSKVLDIQADQITLEGLFDKVAPAPLPIKLIIAMPRPIMLKRILRSISMLGVKEIYLINTSKVEKSFWQSQLLEDNSFEEHLLEGLSHSKDTVMPKLHIRKGFKPFVEEELADIIKGTRALVAHPGDYHPFPQGTTKAMTLAIGPEGGFTEYEVEKLRDVGFEVVHCGSRILRMETAVVSLVSQHGSILN